MPKCTQKTVTLFLTPNYSVTNNVARIGRVKRCADGFDMSEFNLHGRTVAKTRSIYTDGLNACTGCVVLAKKLNNMFHENSSIYSDAEATKPAIFQEITNKILNMMQNAKENIHVGLFGGWGEGCGENIKEVEKSHNLFNNIALCIEDKLPEMEGINIPLLTVWGKRDGSKPDAIYARENIIVLINDVFKNLFKNGKCEMSQNELKDFLREHYEEVLIPDNVVIVPEAKYESLNILDNIERKKKRINLSV